MGISTSQLLAEAKGFGSDVTSAEKRTVHNNSYVENSTL